GRPGRPPDGGNSGRPPSGGVTTTISSPPVRLKLPPEKPRSPSGVGGLTTIDTGSSPPPISGSAGISGKPGASPPPGSSGSAANAGAAASATAAAPASSTYLME